MAANAAARHRLGRRACVLGLVLLGSRLDAQQSGPARREEQELQALERAAFQRALSQRLSKSYLMQAQGIEPAEAGRILEAARLAVEQGQAWLQGASPSPEATRRLFELGQRWAELRAVLQQSPGRAGAEAVYRIGDEMEAAAHRTTIAFEAAFHSASHAGALRGLMLAGRLRMLSERAAKFWLYRHWGLNAAAAEMEMHLARAHFTALLTQVERLDLAPAARAAAAALRERWAAYDAVLQDPARTAAELVRRSELNFEGAQSLVRAMLEAGGVPASSVPARSPSSPQPGGR